MWTMEAVDSDARSKFFGDDATARALATAISILKYGGTHETAETAAFFVLTAAAKHSNNGGARFFENRRRQSKPEHEAVQQARVVSSIAAVAVKTFQDDLNLASNPSLVATSDGSRSSESTDGSRERKTVMQKQARRRRSHKISQNSEEPGPNNKVPGYQTTPETTEPLHWREWTTSSEDRSAFHIVALAKNLTSQSIEDSIPVVVATKVLSNPQTGPSDGKKRAKPKKKFLRKQLNPRIKESIAFKEVDETSIVDSVVACGLSLKIMLLLD